MAPFKRCAILAAAVTAACLFARADTITQVDAEGQTQVIQTQAIVIQNDSYAIVYKHFDLKQRRVVEDRLQQGSLPYAAVVSSASGRRQIVSLWKQFGYTASVAEQNGTKLQVYDAYFDFFPAPGGLGSFLESVPPRTNLPMILNGGGVDEIDFDKIVAIANRGGHLTVTLANGKVESGTFLMPTKQPAVVHLMGITDHYDPSSSKVYDFSEPLSGIKEIHFQSAE